MKKLTKSQVELLGSIRNFLPANTSELAHHRGDFAAYHTNLRDRLFGLAAKGVLQYREKMGPKGGVVERVWRLCD